MDKPKNFLVYCGSPGIGKTYLCAALTGWAFDKFGQNWRYWKENDLLKKLRESMDTMQGDYLDVLKYMIDADFLILDDIGSSTKQSDWREEVLFAVIDYRYNNLLPTMFTSNYSQAEFTEKYHKRVHSRLFSNDNIIIEIHDGVDFRLQELSKMENKIEGFKKE
jgi:DNA replication protein DnaC